MTIDDETLIAFLDGELDAVEMERVAASVDADPALADRVERLAASDAAVRDTYKSIADEAVPDRLIAAVRAQSGDTGTGGTESGISRFPSRPAHRPALPGWGPYAAIAASLVLGVMIGTRFDGGAPHELRFDNERLIAGGTLATALEHQPSGASGPAGTMVQLSFSAEDGRYCRTFLHAGSSGLACRQDQQWVVELTAPAQRENGSVIRTAGSAMPVTVLEAVDARMVGDAFDAATETALIEDAWTPRSD